MEKIPKIIHYCWFGGNQKPPLVLKCIDSWKRILPDYEIKEWNESNFDINFNSYTKNAYQNKKWAFVSDVARLKVLQEEGGIYLDTDMYVLKSFNDFLNHECFIGKEDNDSINAAILGSKRHNDFINNILINYNSREGTLETIPKVITELYKKDPLKYNDVQIFDSIYFYPFSPENIKKFNYKNAPQESYAVHLWDYSWGHPLNRFIKKIGLHKFIKNFTEKLKIKKLLKKLLKMP